jgi:transcriptional regulator
MYIPEHFRILDFERKKAWLSKYNFGILICSDSDSIEITHLPFLFEFKEEQILIYCHLAKENPVYTSIIGGNSKVKVVLQGADGYISSSWYSHENVSTWNYSAAHFEGEATVISEQELLSILKTLTDKYENAVNGFKFFNHLNQRMIHAYLDHIRGLKIVVTKDEFKFKLSQNRKPEEIRNIITQLTLSNPSLAEDMENELKSRKGE